MTREFAIKVLTELRGYGDKFANIGFDRKEALDMAIKALEQETCEDCISRTALLSRIDAERKHLLDLKMDGAEHIVVHHARRIIEDMPSVTPTRPKGEWILDDGLRRIHKCSNCGQLIMTDDIDVYNYCHGCGADMRRGDADDED